MHALEERRRANGPPTVSRCGQTLDLLLALRLVEQRPICSTAVERCIAESPERGRISERILRLQPYVLAGAGPRSRHRRRCVAVAHRGLIDEHHRRQKMRAVFNHRTAVAPVPDCAAAPMASIEGSREAPAE